MIKVQGLTKRLGGKTLFHHLDFVWDKPEILCITGVNGSGKTTLLSMLAGVTQPDDGEIFLLGKKLPEQFNNVTRQLCYVPDNCPVYPFISGQEWLSFVKSLRTVDIELEQALLSGFGLHPHLESKFGEMSLGTARKLLLMSALMFPAALIILDEPSNGLDNSSFDFLCNFLQQRKADSLIVLSCLDRHQQTQFAARLINLHSLERR
jgi:ABC-type multidrug transport system ATPase subunit